MGITFTSFQLPGASLVSQDHRQMRESVKWTLLPVLSLPLGGSNLNKLQYTAKQQQKKKKLGFYIEEKGKEFINVSKALSPATWEAVGGRHQGTIKASHEHAPEQSQVKGISIRQPQDVHGHGTSACGSGGLWPGLACSRTITRGVGWNCHSSPKVQSGAPLCLLWDTEQVLVPLGEGALQEWRTRAWHMSV